MHFLAKPFSLEDLRDAVQRALERRDGSERMIRLPEVCANVCFGGARRNRLFMTASQSLYAVYVETTGAHIA